MPGGIKIIFFKENSRGDNSENIASRVMTLITDAGVKRSALHILCIVGPKKGI
jgi:hypothetical protein